MFQLEIPQYPRERPPRPILDLIEAPTPSFKEPFTIIYGGELISVHWSSWLIASEAYNQSLKEIPDKAGERSLFHPSPKDRRSNP